MDKIGLRRGSHKNALYIFHVDPPDGPIKIGRAGDVFLRWLHLMDSWPYLYTVKPLAIVHGAAGNELEVLQRFQCLRIRGEWHRPGPELLAFAARCQDLQSLLTELHGPLLPLK